MKKLILVGLVCLSALATCADVTLKVIVRGTEIGTTKLTHLNLAKGVTEMQAVMTMKVGDVEYYMKHIDRYDAQSRPISTTIEEKTPEKSTVQKHEYLKDFLRVTITENGKKTVKTVKYPAKKSINRPSQTWFFSQTPMVGAISNENTYQDGKWEVRVSRYMGLTEIKVGEKTVKAYEVVERKDNGKDEVHQWIDLKGMPYRIEMKGEGEPLTMERVE